MAYPKKYKVTAPVWVAGHAPGDTFTVNEQPKYLEWALVQGGLLKLLEEAKLNCPACGETGTKKAAAAEYTADELAAHYASDHPGLVAPEKEE